MTTRNDRKAADHLLHLIVNRSFDVPNFALLLGSGASVTSKVRTAEAMIEEWRRLRYQREGSEEKYRLWIKNQSWYQHEDEYSILFESIYDQPSQRRVVIEECIKNAHPSWGYVYLANLLDSSFFDVVFTTNFDDLLNEACYLYSDGLRPIVGAHDTSIREIRVTSRRPKIVKLHGDFMYDNIKNTIAELETLESNTVRKFKQFAQEYGLVVIGYSGRDRSVMDTIDILLRDEENYRQGVYWCIRRGAEISNRLELLLRRDGVYLVEIDGFDEFMADLHKSAQLALPKPIAEPFEMVRDRTRLFLNVEEALREHPIIRSDMEQVLWAIDDPNPKPPLPIEALRLYSMGQYEAALPVWERAFHEDPKDQVISTYYAETLFRTDKLSGLVEFLDSSPLDVDEKAYYLLLARQDEAVIELARQPLSSESLGRDDGQSGLAFLRINRAIALKRLGRVEEMGADLDRIEESGATTEPRIRAGVSALRGRKDEMLLALSEALNENLAAAQARMFPVFEDYRDDEEFVQLIADHEGATGTLDVP